jgi:hypothetical protein
MNHAARSGHEGGAIGRRVSLVVAGAAAGLVLAVVALFFFIFAAYLGLLAQFAPWQAALIVGGVVLLVALLLLVLASRSAGRTAQRVENAVKASAVVTFAPTALRLASRNMRLTAGLATLLGVVFVVHNARKARDSQL